MIAMVNTINVLKKASKALKKTVNNPELLNKIIKMTCVHIETEIKKGIDKGMNRLAENLEYLQRKNSQLPFNIKND